MICTASQNSMKYFGRKYLSWNVSNVSRNVLKRMLRLNVCDSNMLTDCFWRVLVDAIFLQKMRLSILFSLDVVVGCRHPVKVGGHGQGWWRGRAGRGRKGEGGRRERKGIMSPRRPRTRTRTCSDPPPGKNRLRTRTRTCSWTFKFRHVIRVFHCRGIFSSIQIYIRAQVP